MTAIEDTFAFQLTANGIPFLREYKAIHGRKFRWDFYIPYFEDPGFLIEIQGGIWHKGGHTSGLGVTRDCTKHNLAVLNGFRCLMFTSAMVQSGEAVNLVKEIIAC